MGLRKAYSGSLIQQNFGELPEKHGYLLWDIENDTVQEIDIHNDNSFQVINLISPNYDELNVEIENPTKYMQVRVDWHDLPVYITSKENENLIKKHILDKYQGISDIKFVKYAINEVEQNVSDDDIISKKIFDVDVQKKYFSKYLEEQGFNEADITEVMKLDDIVNEKLSEEDVVYNNNWYIKRLWCDNFQSYDKFDINFDDFRGVLQIVGKNQQGKTTIFKLMCYVLYGETLETKKREKNGDLRYINNKRDLDYCEGGIVINISGKDYCLVRRTERNIARTGTVNVKTFTTFYDVVNGEVKKDESNADASDIKSFVEQTIGNMDQFLRLVFTTSDTLNDLLDFNSSTFKDSVLYDLGLDIFDKKLNIFKDYLKELKSKEEKLQVDVDRTLEAIEGLKTKIEQEKSDISETEEKIKTIEKRIEDGNKHIDSKQKELHLIDEDIKNENPDTLQLKYNSIEEKIKLINETKQSLIDDLSNLREDFDEKEYDELRNSVDVVKTQIFELKQGIKDNKHEEINVENEINTLKTENIKYSTEEEVETRDILREKTTIHNYQTKITTLNNDNTIIINNGKDNKEKISGLEKDLVDVDGEKNCLACGKDMSEFGEEFVKTVNEKKKAIQDKINFLNEKVKEGRELFKKNLSKVKEYEELILDSENKIKQYIEDEKKARKTKIKENEKSIKILSEKLKEIEHKLKKSERNIEELNLSIEETTSNINQLEIIKKEVEKRGRLQLDIDKKDLELKSNELELNNIKNLLDKYEKYRNKIEENEVKEGQLIKFRQVIKDLIDDKDKLVNKKYEHENQIRKFEDQIKEYDNRINRYNEQLRNDKIRESYLKLVHRDGIPTLILKNLLPKINFEMERLLSNQDFNVFFDDDIQLRMSHKFSPEQHMSCLEGSGAERTFTSVVLKVALNNLNNKNKPDFVMFDEIMGKLIDENVDNFITLISELKNIYNYIFVVDHNHTVNPDYIISVSKDENYVSHLTIE